MTSQTWRDVRHMSGGVAGDRRAGSRVRRGISPPRRTGPAPSSPGGSEEELRRRKRRELT
jgi:hypothetical protein